MTDMKKLIMTLAIAINCIGCINANQKQATETNDSESDVIAAIESNSEEEGVNEGDTAPNFTLNDINGNPLSLQSLRGKYLILDFWGSWCGWCIKGIPDMKKYYEKYNSKLEILGIDCRDTDQKWKDAVKNYELPWKHVYCPRDNQLLKTYSIKGFPTKIIIDPKGKIVKTIIGEDPEFYTILDELLK